MFDCLEYLNLYTLAIFLLAFFAIVFARQLLSPFLQLRNHLPIPFEFLLVSSFQLLYCFIALYRVQWEV